MRFVPSDGDSSAPATRREPAALIGSRTCFALAGCALVATAYGLGAGWLGSLILGLPLGVWLVLAGLGSIGRLKNVRPGSRAGTAPAADAAPLRLLSRLLGSAPGVPLREELAFRARDVAGFVRLVLSGPLALAGVAPLRRSESRAATATDRLRIGLDMPRRHADALACALAAERACGLLIEVRRLEESEAGARPLDLGLDALIRSRPSTPAGHADVVILLPEQRDHPAAWPDWACRLPLSYAAVFPARLDPAMVSCGKVDLTEERAPPLLARLAVAAGALARADARNPFRARGEPPSPRRTAPDIVETVMIRLALTLAPRGRAPGSEYAPGALAAAARALSAWLVTNDCSALDPQERRHVVEACSRLAGSDNESLLHVGAARVGAGADAEAASMLAQVHTLLRASPPSRGAGAGGVPDPLPFLIAELELGPPGSLTLGRLAAGICLLWATATPDNLGYLRDDLADEMRHAARLVGNDPDHRLLLELIAMLDGQRPAPRQVRFSDAA